MHPNRRNVRRPTHDHRLSHLPRTVRAAIGAALLVDGWHTCPGGCGETVSPGHVACRDCWLRVPRRIRRDLVVAFRRREADYSAYRVAVDQAEQLVRDHSPHAGEGDTS